MEYNTHTYITILHSDCIVLGLGSGHRKNIDETICILEFDNINVIPWPIYNKIIQAYSHQEILDLIETVGWVDETII